VLGQATLQSFGQQRVGRHFMGACRAGLEMDSDIFPLQRRDLSPLVVEQLRPHIVAIHLLSLFA
jgi:hypothetical protein